MPVVTGFKGGRKEKRTSKNSKRTIHPFQLDVWFIAVNSSFNSCAYNFLFFFYFVCLKKRNSKKRSSAGRTRWGPSDTQPRCISPPSSMCIGYTGEKKWEKILVSCIDRHVTKQKKIVFPILDWPSPVAPSLLESRPRTWSNMRRAWRNYHEHLPSSSCISQHLRDCLSCMTRTSLCRRQ